MSSLGWVGSDLVGSTHDLLLVAGDWWDPGSEDVEVMDILLLLAEVREAARGRAETCNL